MMVFEKKREKTEKKLTRMEQTHRMLQNAVATTIQKGLI